MLISSSGAVGLSKEVTLSPLKGGMTYIILLFVNKDSSVTMCYLDVVVAINSKQQATGNYRCSYIFRTALCRACCRAPHPDSRMFYNVRSRSLDSA